MITAGIFQAKLSLGQLVQSAGVDFDLPLNIEPILQSTQTLPTDVCQSFYECVGQQVTLSSD